MHRLEQCIRRVLLPLHALLRSTGCAQRRTSPAWRVEGDQDDIACTEISSITPQ